MGMQALTRCLCAVPSDAALGAGPAFLNFEGFSHATQCGGNFGVGRRYSLLLFSLSHLISCGRRGSAKRSWSIRRPPRISCQVTQCGDAALRGTGTAHPAGDCQPWWQFSPASPHACLITRKGSKWDTQAGFLLHFARRVLFLTRQKENGGAHLPQAAAYIFRLRDHAKKTQSGSGLPPRPALPFHCYSLISCRTKLPRMPLMNFTVSGVSYFLAISTASLMAAPLGMSGM